MLNQRKIRKVRENHRFLIFVSHQLMYESRWKNMTKMTMGIGYEIYTEIDALYPGFTIRFVESIEKERRYMREFG